MKRALIILSLVFAGQLLTAQPPDTNAIKEQTEAFQAAKGELDCPMINGKFDHSVIYLDAERQLTRGLDIVSTNDTVLCIFKGNVVFTLPEEGNTFSVIISHGDYFTVYKKLTTVMVKSGELLKPGDSVGTCGLDDRNQYNMHFEIWQGTDKLWPVDWIRCK